MQKIVFFDIDGTLWDYRGHIPQSTKDGIAMLRKNGHLAFLCTGRTKSTIRADELLNIGFDGIIAGCGTYIEYNYNVLVNKLLSWEDTEKLVPAMKSKGIGAFLEGCDKLYIDWDYYTGSDYAEGFRRELGTDCLDIELADADSRINKISVEYIDLSDDEVRGTFGEDYDVIIHDFTNPDGSPLNVAEIVPKGISKAWGIKWICRHLGISIENTYAFGDSANDIDMLKYVKHGIAMGNASEITKNAADYITTDMYNDGILNGLKHYELI